MSLTAFFKENSHRPENQKFSLSPRFQENGEEIFWEIRALHATEESTIQQRCFEGNPLHFNTQKYWLLMVANSVVYPTLQDAALQDSYGVFSDTDLLLEMLTPGEYATLLQNIQAINGFSKDMDETIDLAKN